MTTGNWIADGLNQHFADEARWEDKQAKIDKLNSRIEYLESEKDSLQEQWDDLDCESQELQEQRYKLENE